MTVVKTTVAKFNKATNAFGVRRVELPGWEPGQPVTVQSHKTGKLVEFEQTEEVRDGHRIVGWRFKPSRKSLRAVPEAAGIRLGVKNDL